MMRISRTLNINALPGHGPEVISTILMPIWDLPTNTVRLGYVWSACQGGGLAIFDAKKKKGIVLVASPPFLRNLPFGPAQRGYRNGNLLLVPKAGRFW